MTADARQIHPQLNEEISWFALGQYAYRNNSFHSGLDELKDKADKGPLVMKISQDIEDLKTILPNRHQQDHRKWIAIMEFYRDSNLEGGEGRDKGKGEGRDKGKGEGRDKGKGKGKDKDKDKANDEWVEALPMDLKAMPTDLLREPFVAGVFRRPEQAIVKGLARGRRAESRSDPQESEPLKRKAEILDNDDDNKSAWPSRKKGVDKDPLEKSEISRVYEMMARLASLNPGGARNTLDAFRNQVEDKLKKIEAEKNKRQKVAKTGSPSKRN